MDGWSKSKSLNTTNSCTGSNSSNFCISGSRVRNNSPIFCCATNWIRPACSWDYSGSIGVHNHCKNSCWSIRSDSSICNALCFIANYDHTTIVLFFAWKDTRPHVPIWCQSWLCEVLHFESRIPQISAIRNIHPTPIFDWPLSKLLIGRFDNSHRTSSLSNSLGLHAHICLYESRHTHTHRYKRTNADTYAYVGMAFDSHH